MTAPTPLFTGVLATAAFIFGVLSFSTAMPPAQIQKGQEAIGPIDNYTCPGDGVFPHEDCQLYIECWANIATLFQCTDVMLFDLRYNGCNYAQYVDCGDRQRPPDFPSTVTPPETTPTSTTLDPSAPTEPTEPTTPPPNGTFVCPNDGVFPHEQRCEYYWQCFLGTAELIHCQLDYLFDLRYDGCNFPQYVDCGERERPEGSPSTVTPPEGTTQPTTAGTGTGSTDDATNPTGGPGFECPQPDGTFPDPEDCAGFYVCLSNIPIHENCPGGLHFNPATELCDWPDVVQCEIGAN